MKKSVLFSLAFLFAATLLCQERFSFNKDGLSPKYLIVDVPNKTQDQIFNSAINWIKETYKNPDEVIKTTIDNKKIRFEGSQNKNLCASFLMPTCYNSRYTIEIALKDGKYRFTPISLSYHMPATQSTSPQPIYIELNSSPFIYRPNGKIKGIYKLFPSTIEALFNRLNNSLNTYIKNEANSSESDDSW